jgi:hypothetical protein
MSKYAFIVGSCSKYTPELCALLNSLDYVGNEQDVHIIGIDLPEELLSQLHKLNYTAYHHAISKEEIEESRGISEVVCRKRYWYAAEIGTKYEYKAVCVLDADLVFNRDPVQFFTIAEKTGYILGPCKEQNKVYDDPHHEVNGEWIWNVPRGFYNEKDMCNCPVFLDPKVWEDALRLSWDIFLNRGFRAPDMCAMNLSFLQFGSYDKTITLPGIQWLGTNEQMLKPYIRAVERHGKIYTESGIAIFCYHGHYAHEIWRKCQLDNRDHCIQGYLKAKDESLLCSNNIAQGSMNLLYETFKKMFFGKIQISAANYRSPENDYKKEYGDLWPL